jgi:hypothetical protein
MKMLILDDDETRHYWFSFRFSDHERTHVRNYFEAIDALVSDRFDIAFLDHDLDELAVSPQYVDHRPLNGMDVVRFIINLPEADRPKHFVVHSLNPVGGLRMHNELLRNGCESIRWPFRSSSISVNG